MVHISFSEIIVILLVALLVIKPEQLPQVARMLGRWVGRAKGLITNVKNEVGAELGKYSFQEEKREK